MYDLFCSLGQEGTHQTLWKENVAYFFRCEGVEKLMIIAWDGELVGHVEQKPKPKAWLIQSVTPSSLGLPGPVECTGEADGHPVWPYSERAHRWAGEAELQADVVSE